MADTTEVQKIIIRKGLIDMTYSSYNLYKDGELVGTYSAKEITEICGCTHVGEYCNRGWPYKGIYRFEKIRNIKEEMKEEREGFSKWFKEEWDNVRFKFLRYYGKA